MPTVRRLGPGDEQSLERFLARHASSTMFLRSNVRAAGLVDRGETYQGTYIAAFEDDDIVAVAAHFWNGGIIVQAPAALDALVRAAIEASGRAVGSILGPWEQALHARAALGLDGAPARKTSREILFALDLRDLVRPMALTGGVVRCRSSRDADLETLVAWRVAYCIEELSARDGPELHARCVKEVGGLHAARQYWVVTDVHGAPLACSAFNAVLPDVVQLGGVYTPPPLRSRGYARSVVAGSLLEASRRGVTSAALFTGEDNVAAQRAYRAIGFREVGDYGLLIFE